MPLPATQRKERPGYIDDRGDLGGGGGGTENKIFTPISMGFTTGRKFTERPTFYQLYIFDLKLISTPPSP
jgi:hypothetical protein